MDNQSRKHERAKKYVENVKGFYNHLMVYIVINTLLQLFYAGVFDGGKISMYIPVWSRFIGPSCWAIGLTCHGIWVFKGHKIKKLWKGWEDRKIKEIMKKEEERNDHDWR